MRIFGSTTFILALGASAVAGHSVHSTFEHGHHTPAISYSTIDMDHSQHATPNHHDIHELHGIQIEDHKHEHDHFAAYDHGHHQEHHDDHKDHHDDSHPKYDYKYGVKDSKSGDVKEQWESRDGDKVKGGYAFKEADGTTRIVHYTSDKKKGFEAIVHKVGHAKEEHKEHQHQEHHVDHVDFSRHGHGWDY